MKQILLIAFILFLVFPGEPLLSQVVSPSADQGESYGDLFSRRDAPASFAKPIPSSSAFFSIDQPAFDRLSVASHPVLTIPNFPLSATRRVSLRLRQFEVLGPGAPVVAGTPEGDRPAQIPRGLFFSGSVPEISGSFVYLALFPEYCSGYVEVPDAEGSTRRYAIAPLELVEGTPSVMVIYDEVEALRAVEATGEKIGTWSCAAEGVEGYYEESAKVFESVRQSGKGSDRRMQSNTMLLAQIAIEGDGEFYSAHGRSLSRAANYALTVVGAISAIYQRDVNITLQVPYLRIWTGSDPYPGTTSNALLPQLRSYWNANMSSVRRAVTHMFSRSSIGGGIAYLNVLCANTNNGYGYSLTGLNNNVTYPTSAYVWDTDASSHEIGHNFGSPHTHSCQWEPAIDSCYTSEGGCFSGTKPRVGTIMSYCHLTPYGTQLYMHPRVAGLIRSKGESFSCVSKLEGSAVNDVAVANINVPSNGGRIAAMARFVPSAAFRNLGTNPQFGLTTTLTIRDSSGGLVFSDVRTIPTLQPGATAAVSYAETLIGPIARYSVTVTVTLTGDTYQANNTMVRPFEIVSSTSGSLKLLNPNNTAIFRSGETVTIQWSHSGSIANARIDFSPDDGATWQTVVTNVTPSSGSYAWTVPPIATRSGRIRISDRENSMTSDQNDLPFTIEVLPLDWQWARTLGGLKNEDVRGVATDAQGNVYVAGGFTDSMVAGGTKVFAVGGMDVFLARYNAGGTLQWLRSFGGSGNDTAMGVAVGGNGDVVLTGGFYGSMVVGSQTLTSAGDEDVFVVKYGSDGNVKWSQGGGGIGRDEGRGIAVDGSGNAAVTGLFSGSGSFGGVTLASQGQTDMFVVKYGGDGNVQWGERGGGNDVDEGNGVAIDGSGNVVVVGRYRGSGGFGGDMLKSAGGDDGFVAKYNSSGAAQWGATLGGSSNDDARAVRVDGNRNVVVTGTVSGLVNFGTIFASSAGGRDVYVAKYNAIGTVQWVRTGGGSGDDYATAMAMDGDGNSYIAGHFEGTFSIADETVVSSGESDVMVVKLSTDGLLNWARRGGGARGEEVYDISVGARGENATVAGLFTYNPPLDLPSIFGPESLEGIGLTDVLTARLAMFRVISPAEGDIWPVSSTKTITWSNFDAANVRIEYSSNRGATWNTIIASTPNDGSHPWVLPANHMQTVVVRISDAANPSVYGYAMSGTFIVLGTAPVTDLTATPADGAVDLSWTPSMSAGVTGYVLLRGTTLQSMVPIKVLSAADRTYRDVNVTNCTLYIYSMITQVGIKESEKADTAGATPGVPKAFTWKSPLGDEIVTAGSAKALNWTSTGCIGTVRIFYSIDGGANWEPVVAETANNGSFNWQVPNVSSAHALVRIIDRDEPSVIAISDTFSICNLPATIAVSGVTSLCEGDPTQLSAPAGFAAYLWSTGATTQSIIVTEPGTYSVTVTDAGGCTAASEQVVVKMNPKPHPTATASGPTTFCLGESVTLSAPEGYAEYRWSTGHTSREITVVQAGSYWVMVTDANGCRGASEPVTVMVNATPQPVITADGPTSFYAGQSVTLTAPDGYSSYLWSNGATTRSITVTEPGTYTVTVSHEESCPATSQPLIVKIIPATQPTVTAVGPTVLCEGDSVALVAADGYASYQWSNGATTRRIVVGESGSYTVTVVSGTGQSGTSEPIDVLVHAAPVRPVLARAAGTDSIYCTGANGLLFWELDGAPIEGALGEGILARRDGIYTVTVVDNNGCMAVSDPLPLTLMAHSGVAIAGERGVMLHPNPSNGRFVVEMNLLRTVPIRISVTDLQGNSVLRIDEPPASGGYRREIDLTRLPSGAYMIELQAGPARWVRKIVKQ